MTAEVEAPRERLLALKQAWRRWKRDSRDPKRRRYREFRYKGWEDGILPIHLLYSPQFGRQLTADMETVVSRFVISIGWDGKKTHYGIVLQIYDQGYELGAHTDGPASNRATLIELVRPKKGGVFFVEGWHRRHFHRRVVNFDGGVHPHGFTRIEEGRRVTLLIQRGSVGRGLPR